VSETDVWPNGAHHGVSLEHFFQPPWASMVAVMDRRHASAAAEVATTVSPTTSTLTPKDRSDRGRWICYSAAVSSQGSARIEVGIAPPRLPVHHGPASGRSAC
jgi:hypothetical protein